MANARLPKIQRYANAVLIIPTLKILVSWRRNDLAHELFDGLPEVTRAQILHQSPGIFGGPNSQNVTTQPVVTIGRRKGNEENMGEYAQGPTPTDLKPSLYLPSLKAFLRGSMGHIYTGILVCPGGFNVMNGLVRNPNLGLPEQREREMIFLAPNDPPSAAEQEADAIAEPYLNKTFSAAEVTGQAGRVRGRVQPGSSGYQSWDTGTQTMKLHQHAIVHGRANDGRMDRGDPNMRATEAQSHLQLKRMIVESNRYRGIIPDIANPDGSGIFIGFTVMKGGRDSGNVTLDNVYGWTSNTMNKNAFKTPMGVYQQRLDAKEQVISNAINAAQDGAESARLRLKLINLRGRSRAQVSREFAQKIKGALDRLLTLQINDNMPNDPHFVSIIRHWGPYI